MSIRQQTALDIVLAHREIETAEKLLTEVDKHLREGSIPDARDALGRPRDGLELAVPGALGETRLFNVPWSIARTVIEAHIAAQKELLAVLNNIALSEIDAATSGDAK